MTIKTPPPGGLRVVLFDWDGTLVNSADVSYRCYARVFESFGIPFDRALFERTYSPDGHRTYAEMGLQESLWVEADARWRHYYALEESPLIPGAAEALRQLGDAGLEQGLVTSGDRQRVIRELLSLTVEGFFRTVVCSEDARLKKPHPEALLIALKRLETEPREAAYVGDSPEDVLMARAAGVYSVGIPGNFPNREALRASSPDLLAADLSEAVGVLVGAVVPPPEGQ